MQPGVKKYNRLQRIQIKDHCNNNNERYVLSFACAKERTKEKHTGNDVRPLPDAMIKLQCYAKGIPSGLLTEPSNSYHLHRR